ncbi:TlpA family protein disulfide reductase [Pontibacter mangrovi]|uniref:TlpA family protein disulfide reductase n=1 Tax=Pontibacter mangrovi TaxID=2589816 RepID=A0A501WCX1_9BACT|nr:TlpA disulfide reductase family protein [Pontibacter mangrovi]TPE46240.1 TlpA family protein disulfide reductase [Pontibacter mangrovi]
MNKKKFSFRNIPGWAVMLGIFAILYLTGLHTEAIGQVQRLLLATGIKNADVPETLQNPDANAVTTAAAASGAEMAGAGFKMVDLEGKQVSFESLKGKVVFMNIWATWCPPCVAEMPNIQKLYEKIGSTDKVAFVMLSVDEGGMEKVQKFISKKGFTFPVYMPASQFPQEFYSNAIPTTFIISPEGKIVAKQEGMADYDTPEVRDFLLSMTKK